MIFFEKNSGWTPQIALTRVWQVYRSMHSYTRDTALPIVKSGRNTSIKHIGSAVIRSGKMVEEITPDETLLFNAFNRESTQGKIEVMDHASVLIVKNTTKHKSKLIDNKPQMDSDIYLKVVILETRENPTSDSIKEELKTLLNERFNHMFKNIQEKEADILGLGQYFRTKIPREQLKRWRTDYYPQLELNLSVHIDIQNEGNLNTLSE